MRTIPTVSRPHKPSRTKERQDPQLDCDGRMDRVASAVADWTETVKVPWPIWKPFTQELAMAQAPKTSAATNTLDALSNPDGMGL
ncbi:hypothetical protein BGX33_003520 [Mortierella sp. NVP41]|nr:hypothetical protein BGX33_003520 [Mortierella sp. NVP41]